MFLVFEIQSLSAARAHNTKLGFTLQDDSKLQGHLKLWMRGASRAVERDQGRKRHAVVFNPVAACTTQEGYLLLSWPGIGLDVFADFSMADVARSGNIGAQRQLNVSSTSVQSGCISKNSKRSCVLDTPRPVCAARAASAFSIALGALRCHWTVAWVFSVPLRTEGICQRRDRFVDGSGAAAPF